MDKVARVKISPYKAESSKPRFQLMSEHGTEFNGFPYLLLLKLLSSSSRFPVSKYVACFLRYFSNPDSEALVFVKIAVGFSLLFNHPLSVKGFPLFRTIILQFLCNQFLILKLL